MIPAALLGAILSAALPVHVEAGACPSGAEVERRLEQMLSSSSGAVGDADVARVVRSGEGMRIELASADGAVIAQRTLPYAGTCAELADMVAVIVASWESDVHPAFTRPNADLVPVSVPGGVERPEPAGASLDLSAGVGTSLADSVSMGGALVVAWFPHGVGLGGRVSGLAETTHSVYLGTRQARWRRWFAGAEVDWRFPGATTSLDLHGGVALAILQASGVDFDQNQSDTSWSAAVLLGGRWSLWISRHWAAYADVTGGYCQRDQTLHGSGVDHQLSHFQGLLSLGFAARETWPQR